jgi:hypothetical protein
MLGKYLSSLVTGSLRATQFHGFDLALYEKLSQFFIYCEVGMCRPVWEKHPQENEMVKLFLCLIKPQAISVYRTVEL